MKYILKLSAICVIALSLNSHAGTDWTTVHSRANCLNNESITWWYLHPYNWKVVSIHRLRTNQTHVIDTGYKVTWRQHAIHWGEPIPTDGGWEVWGYHYLYNNNGGFPFDSTYATNCSIYDGW